MSLDLALLDAEGKPEVMVSLEPNDHWAIMQILEGLLEEDETSVLQRFHDYYAEAEIVPEEVAPLLRDLRRVRAACTDWVIQPTLDSLIRLTEEAERRGSGLLAIPD